MASSRLPIAAGGVYYPRGVRRRVSSPRVLAFLRRRESYGPSTTGSLCVFCRVCRRPGPHGGYGARRTPVQATPVCVMSRGEQGRRKRCPGLLKRTILPTPRMPWRAPCGATRRGCGETMEKARVQRPQMTPAQAADLFAFFAGAWRVDKAGDPAQGGRRPPGEVLRFLPRRAVSGSARSCGAGWDVLLILHGVVIVAAWSGNALAHGVKEHGVAEIHAGGNVPPDRASEQQKTVRVDLPAFVGKLFEEHDADMRGEGPGAGGPSPLRGVSVGLQFGLNASQGRNKTGTRFGLPRGGVGSCLPGVSSYLVPELAVLLQLAFVLAPSPDRAEVDLVPTRDRDSRVERLSVAPEVERRQRSRQESVGDRSSAAVSPTFTSAGLIRRSLPIDRGPGGNSTKNGVRLWT